MLIWFFSGLVMIYAGASCVDSLTRLAHSQALPERPCRWSAGQFGGAPGLNAPMRRRLRRG